MMKNSLSILIVAAICSMICKNAFSQTFNAAADSSKAIYSQFSQAFSSNSRIIQNRNNSNQSENPKFDCNELVLGASTPSIKTFEPDTSLTASMPILEPTPVDQEIFISGFDCIKSDSLD